MKTRKQFTFYLSFFDAIRELPDGQREALYDAVCSFALYGQMTEFEPLAQRVAMKLILPNLISSRAKALAAQGKSADPSTTGSKKKENKKEKEVKKEVKKETKKETEKKNEGEAEPKKKGEGKGEGKGNRPAPDPAAQSQKKDGRERERLTKSFDQFWEAYPVKLSKDKAWSAWQRLKPELGPLLASLEAWQQAPAWTDEGGRFIPMAYRFLSQGYYLQQPPEPKEDKVPKGASGRISSGELEAMRKMMGQAGPEGDGAA